MAIDSALKRRSVSGIAFRKRGPGVTPNASKPVEWRYNAGRMYSGIVSPAPPVSGEPRNPLFLNMTFGRFMSS